MKVPCTMGYTATAIAIMLYQISKVMEERKLSRHKLSEICGIDRSPLTSILENRSKSRTDAPDRSHRLISVLKIRTSLGIPTRVESSDGEIQLDLNKPETYTWLSENVHNLLMNSKDTSANLERAAHVHRGQVTMFVKAPDQFITLRVALNCYSYWIKEISFVF